MATTLVAENAAVVKLRIEELEQQLRAQQELLANATPREPIGDGTVVRFTNWEGYEYAAIRVPQRGVTSSPFAATAHRWYVTQDGSRSSRQGVPPKNWVELLNWIGAKNWHTIEVLS